jgi:hypothetical protein
LCATVEGDTVAGMTQDQPVGFSIDDLLRDLTKPKRRRPRSSTSGSNDMDAAVRRAVRAELADVERALKALVTEVGRLRRSNEDLADKVARLARR